MLARITLGRQEYVALTSAKGLLVEVSRLLSKDKDCRHTRDCKAYVKAAIRAMTRRDNDDQL